MMKASKIMDAITAMDAVYRLTFSSDPIHFGRTMTQMQIARNALAAELDKIDVAVEPVPDVEPQTCAEYYGVDKPDLAVVKKEG
jgi:hypothetical protein